MNLQLIGGEWADAKNGKRWKLIDPSNEQLITEVPFGDQTDCRLAIEAATRAFPAWSRSTAYARAGYLLEAARLIRSRIPELAENMSREAGKPQIEARGEWSVAADLIEWFAEEGKRAYGRTIPSRKPGKRMTVILQPLGVVGVITAWNFPAYNPARAWGAALAAGCTVVARPSELTPLSAMALASIFKEAGLPAGVLNLINGEPESMAQEMLNNPLLRKISFTGSPRVGKILMDGASRTMTRLSLELGGNAPVLILSDVDLKAVAASAVVSKFRNCGQVCVSPQRFIVHSKIKQQFLDEVGSRISALKVGPGNDPNSEVGPLISAAHRERIERLLRTAASEGASSVVGGKRPGNLKSGFFLEPTLISEVPAQSALLKEEIFGPIMPVTHFSDLDEAIQSANSVSQGLAAYVWTNDLSAATYAAERLECGIVGINEWAPHGTEAPFGGWKESGLGHECGSEGLIDYMEKKLVSSFFEKLV